jgi:hypothetical protein
MFVVTEIDAAAIRAQPLRLHLSEMLTVQLSLTENPLNRAGIADRGGTARWHSPFNQQRCALSACVHAASALDSLAPAQGEGRVIA